MRIAFVLLMLMLSGCAELNSLVGGSTTYILSPEPGRGGCTDSTCQQLDNYEIQLYNAARSGRITWVQMVSAFYQKRDQLFPDSQDNDSTREMRTYQRVLAEQMDKRQITEAQWAYLLDKKFGDLNARNTMLRNSRPQSTSTSCTTKNTGTTTNPTYTTQCN